MYMALYLISSNKINYDWGAKRFFIMRPRLRVLSVNWFFVVWLLKILSFLDCFFCSNYDRNLYQEQKSKYYNLHLINKFECRKTSKFLSQKNITTNDSPNSTKSMCNSSAKHHWINQPPAISPKRKGNPSNDKELRLWSSWGRSIWSGSTFAESKIWRCLPIWMCSTCNM